MLDRLSRNVPLRPLTTLKAGGDAELFFASRSVDEIAEVALRAQQTNLHVTTLGSGSNVLPSDDGVAGLVLYNQAANILVDGDGEVTADTGCWFQDLFLATAQAGLHGLEFAVGIPGTLGGALVSNAGAYRSNVSDHLTEIEIVFEGERRWVDPEFMQFSYRDSILRRQEPPQCVMLRTRFRLPKADAKGIYDEAREYQRQRIGKQPAPASAGSFFKNVYDQGLADSLDDLPDPLKEAGVVPSGYLIEAVGLRGFKYAGAMIANRHANFIVNSGGAKASAIRQLAEYAKRAVRERFGVELEEEVLYLGDWSGFRTERIPD